MLLKLAEHCGKTSRETAAAIFQEMLHVGIGELPFCGTGGGAGYLFIIEPNLTTLLRLLQAYIYNNGELLYYATKVEHFCIRVETLYYGHFGTT